MNFKHDINIELMASGDFFVESVSAAHRHIDSPRGRMRYANEHKHDRLLCIVSGECDFDMFNNDPIHAGAGSIVYIPYNIAYKAEWKQTPRGEVYSLNYIMKNLEGHQITLGNEIHKFNNCDSKLILSMFKECCYFFSSESFGFNLKCKYLLLKIFYTIANAENARSGSKIAKAIRYINANYTDETPVAELAQMCNLGECMFRRCFKAETGISPLKYRNMLRINKAYELLITESVSVAEAMEMTGFFDASYFNKTFKAFMGKSPSECKRR